MFVQARMEQRHEMNRTAVGSSGCTARSPVVRQIVPRSMDFVLSLRGSRRCVLWALRFIVRDARVTRAALAL